MNDATLTAMRAQIVDAGFTDIATSIMSESAVVHVTAVDRWGDRRQTRLTRAGDVADVLAKLERASALA
jgi:hypothetical protein